MNSDALERFLGVLAIFRGNPWYDVSAETVETVANILRNEGQPMAFYVGMSSDPPEKVREMILARTEAHGAVTAPTALFRVKCDAGGTERVYLAPRGRTWKRRVESRMSAQ